MNTSVANTYNRKKLNFTHGSGIYLFSDENKKYIDLAAGIAVNLLGHSNKKLINALHKQSKKLWHVSNLYKIEEQEQLAINISERRRRDLQLGPVPKLGSAVGTRSC